MSRYQPLADYLSALEGPQWDASFADIERQLGFPLPHSAHKYAAWWANQTGPGHSQTRGWRSVGWRTSALDLEGRRVRFEREARRDPPENAGGSEAELRRLLEAATALTGIDDRGQLIRAALGALIAREAASGLAALGGTMPNFEAPARRRPAA